MGAIKYEDVTQTLIASLDILGVKQIMINASPTELIGIANKIKTAFSDSTNRLKNDVEGRLKQQHNETLKQIKGVVDTMMRNTFSDTIVISLTLKDIEPAQRSIAIQLFFLQVRIIAYEMFFAGYPIRGCIDYGEIYQENNIVVGAPYVKSLITAECLQFSGVVITETAFKMCRPALSQTPIVPIIPDLCVPTKNGAMKMPCLNWIRRAPKTKRCDVFFDGTDWRQVLYEKFAANGKSIDESVWPKLQNTENVIKALINQIHIQEHK